MFAQGNAAVIADLKRRFGRISKWRLFLLLLMPIGFILPCALAIVIGLAQGQAAA
jgi:hypothetical protein